MPLRIRLVVILVLLVAVALAAVEPITYTTTRNSLIQKVNAQMAGSVGAWTQYFASLQGAPSPGEVLVPYTFGGLYSPRGRAVPFSPIRNQDGTLSVSNPVSGCTDCLPVTLTSSFVRQAALAASGAQSSNNEAFEFLAGPRGGFQVLATIISGYVLVVALPLTGVNETMGHVLALELIIGAGIMAAVALVAWFLVRLGLRPLERMASTASEIAAGDLTKRVEDTDERTEVGQLGAALNVMLTQIERAFREREASEDRLRRFVGDASHELRTPLTSIRGYAELFKDGSGGRPEDLATALRRIESESTRMGGLVDDLLLLARLDQGRPLGHDRVDLAQLAGDAVQDASVVDPSRSITLVSTGPCVVVGDDQRLRQVLGNLIANAIAYAPPGSPIEVAVQLEWVPVDVSGLPGVPAVPAVGKFGRLTRAGRPFGSGDPGDTSVRPLGATDLVVAGEEARVTPTGSNGDHAGAGGTEQSGSDGVEQGDGVGALAGSPARTMSAPDLALAPALGLPGSQAGTAGVPGLAPAHGARAVVAVIDHGPGIDSETAPHVFERFWRADQSRQRSSGGTGLGLSIVAAVVAAHGGQVVIRQTPGGGATFVVQLPAALGPVPPAASSGTGPAAERIG